MTARVFADTNIAIYAEGSDVGKALRATAILESSPVISSQIVTETISTLTRKYDFTLTEAHEVALSLLDLCELVPVGADTIREEIRHYLAALVAQLVQCYETERTIDVIAACSSRARSNDNDCVRG